MQQRDCILVLGSGVTPDGGLTLIGKSRVEKGVELYKRGYAKRVLFCGKGYWHKNEKVSNKTEACAMRDYGVSLGIPAQHIFLEEESRETIGNAYFAKIFLEKVNWRSFFVVTSNVYLPKTEFAFKKVFGKEFTFDIIPCMTFLDAEELLDRVDSEKEKLMMYKESFSQVNDGDDRSVRKVLATFPWYNQILIA